jgi:hypothetical protein
LKGKNKGTKRKRQQNGRNSYREEKEMKEKELLE